MISNRRSINNDSLRTTSSVVGVDETSEPLSRVRDGSDRHTARRYDDSNRRWQRYNNGREWKNSAECGRGTGPIRSFEWTRQRYGYGERDQRQNSGRAGFEQRDGDGKSQRGVADGDVEHDFRQVAANAVTEIQLRGVIIGVAGAKALAEALKINSSVTNINLAGSKIGVDGAKALAEALKINSSVTNINLEANKLGFIGRLNTSNGQGTKALAEALKINSSVTNFSLGLNRIRDGGAKALAEALTINTSVTNINLHGNEIGDDGAKALAEALKIGSVTNANLSMNQISKDGAKALAQALKINSSVVVNLAWNQDDFNREVQALSTRNKAIAWKNIKPRLLDICIALAPLNLPAYVILEILDKLPLVELVNHGKKIALIISVKNFYQNR